MGSICRNSSKRNLSKKNPTIEEDTSNLPCDIIENILSRLPVKSLIRFKSVSKPWCSLISDAKFARSHLNQTKNSDFKTLYLCSFLRAEAFTFLKFTNQNFQLEALEFPLKNYRKFHVLCSCDGLVLLKKINSRCELMWVLWNPSTRTYTKLSCNYLRIYHNSYGLCYDAFSDDYKIIFSISKTRYAVFSCKNNSWIEKEDDSPLRIRPDYPWRGLFVNGALHWRVTKILKSSDSIAEEEVTSSISYGNSTFIRCNYNYTYEICCFDPRDDNFKMLSKPACFDIKSVFHLTDLGGQLCLYRNTYDFKMVEIWRMKEYGDFDSWTRLLTIENVPVPHKCYHVNPLCLINKNIIILDIYSLGLFAYIPKEHTFCKMHINGAEKLISEEGMHLTPLLCWNDSLLLPRRIIRN